MTDLKTANRHFPTEEIYRVIGSKRHEGQSRELVAGSSGARICEVLSIAIESHIAGDENSFESYLNMGLALLTTAIEQNNFQLRIGIHLETIKGQLAFLGIIPNHSLKNTVSELIQKTSKEEQSQKELLKSGDINIVAVNNVSSPELSPETIESNQIDKICEQITTCIKEKLNEEYLLLIVEDIKKNIRIGEVKKNAIFNHIERIHKALLELKTKNNSPESKDKEKLIASLNLGQELVLLLRIKHHPTEIHHHNIRKLAANFRKWWNQTSQLINRFGKLTVELEIACFLHDLGKLNVPIGLLDSEKKFTAQEMNSIKQHVVDSEEIIKSVFESSKNHPSQNLIVEGVANHHQQYDGRGYPEKNLSGRKTSFYGQLVAALDMLEAITSDGRTYRKQISVYNALEFMKKTAAGRKIAPVIMNLLIIAFNTGNFDNFFNEKAKENEAYIPICVIFPSSYLKKVCEEIVKTNLKHLHQENLVAQLEKLYQEYEEKDLNLTPEMIEDEVKLYCKKSGSDYHEIWPHIEVAMNSAETQIPPKNFSDQWAELEKWLISGNFYNTPFHGQQLSSSPKRFDTEDKLRPLSHKP